MNVLKNAWRKSACRSVAEGPPSTECVKQRLAHTRGFTGTALQRWAVVFGRLWETWIEEEAGRGEQKWPWRAVQPPGSTPSDKGFYQTSLRPFTQRWGLKGACGELLWEMFDVLTSFCFGEMDLLHLVWNIWRKWDVVPQKATQHITNVKTPSVELIPQYRCSNCTCSVTAGSYGLCQIWSLWHVERVETVKETSWRSVYGRLQETLNVWV